MASPSDPTPAAVGYPPRGNRVLLRLEGAAFAAGAVYLYSTFDLSWWLFAALILAPDLSALGYLKGREFGARTYNAAHIWLWPVALGIVGFILLRNDPASSPVVLGIALIWAVHIGADRALGYGLKFPGSFDRTHLGPIGRAARGGSTGA
ncbi:MAG: DUF4260 domain-containing protein [Bauldia sp.]|nr:DUF4260 domain-containing protein [Bauldia sp.]